MSFVSEFIFKKLEPLKKEIVRSVGFINLPGTEIITKAVLPST